MILSVLEQLGLKLDGSIGEDRKATGFRDLRNRVVSGKVAALDLP